MVQRGLSAAQAARQVEKDKFESEQLNSQATAKLELARERTKIIERVVGELAGLPEVQVAIKFKAEKFNPKNFYMHGVLSVGYTDYQVIVDHEYYGLYIDFHNLRKLHVFEGTSSNLSDHLNALAYLVGSRYPAQAAEIDSIVKPFL